MESIKWAMNILKKVEPISAGTYSAICYTKENKPYKLLLRITNNGNGRLILNARTVLFLNQTSAEYIYHFMQGKYGDDVVAYMQSRYHSSKSEILLDYEKLIDELERMLVTEDLDPVIIKRPIGLDIAEADSIMKLDVYLNFQAIADEVSQVRLLETKKWIDIFDQALKNDVPHIVLLGGQPMIRSDVYDLIGYLEKLGMVSGLVSSQQHLNIKNVQQLISRGLDHLSLIVPLGSEPDFELIRNIDKENLFFVTVFEVDHKSIDTISESLRNLANIGIRNVSFEVLDPIDQSIFGGLFDKLDEFGLSFIPMHEVVVRDPLGADLDRFVGRNMEERNNVVICPDGTLKKLSNHNIETIGDALTCKWG